MRRLFAFQRKPTVQRSSDFSQPMAHSLLSAASLCCLAILTILTGADQTSGTPWPAPTINPQLLANSPLLDSLLRTTPQLRAVASRADEYELQIIYTQINRNVQHQPQFIQHNFQLNPGRYFDPASLVKLPTAALALEKLNSLALPGLTRSTPMATRTAFRCQTAASASISADSDQINSVGNYIKRMLLISDNDAYNRLYEFVGQQQLNERLAQLGYSNARIVRRFAPCDTQANRYTNPINFVNPTGNVVYRQPALYNPIVFQPPLGPVFKGRGQKVGGRLVLKPYDFTKANYLSLQTATDMLKAVLWPTVTSTYRRFKLSPKDYAFLRYYLQSTPHASGYAPYAKPNYFDAYKKYLYYGRERETKTNPALRIHNVVGMSHGYLSDVAYFADTTRHSEFLLSATLYVNRDGIINDGVYEYESVGFPFLKNLGQVLAKYENDRCRQVAPTTEDLFGIELK